MSTLFALPTLWILIASTIATFSGHPSALLAFCGYTILRFACYRIWKTLFLFRGDIEGPKIAATLIVGSVSIAISVLLLSGSAWKLVAFNVHISIFWLAILLAILSATFEPATSL